MPPRIPECAPSAADVDVHSGLPEVLQALILKPYTAAPGPLTYMLATEPLIEVQAVAVEGRDPNNELLEMPLALPVKVASRMETYEAGLPLGEIEVTKMLTDIAPWAASNAPPMVRTRLLSVLVETKIGCQEIEAFWKQWGGRDAKSVRLFWK
ncbi:hypothetical protein BDZ97DRAFT_1922090 [Flammula alnicola]|nr:hypothetical protein BDZ97DRAFT_1922090 [Flammula alnicola]